ncbi:hypothetical protein V1502_11595 [Bacillus sp. SCS-153A]|uniref:hypothetical protein n=1 Tax=Rossellomorea sedimentorum TaxID=3115294 RepID=UPI003905AAB1
MFYIIAAAILIGLYTFFQAKKIFQNESKVGGVAVGCIALLVMATPYIYSVLDSYW